MLKDKFVICINREHGSGGRSIGKILSEELGIHFYDHQILGISAEISGEGEPVIRLKEEQGGTAILHRIFDSLKSKLEESETAEEINDPDELFRIQARLITELASRETCIIAGRAADWVLKEAGAKDVVSFFLYSDMPVKIRRIMEMDGLDAESAKQVILRADNERKAYYRYYTGEKWDDCKHYDLCINTSELSGEQAARVIKNFMRARGYEL